MKFGNIELLNYDCADLIRGIPDKYFDLAIVDPPYGMNIVKNGTLNISSNTKGIYQPKTWDEKIPDAEYFNEVQRVSKNQIIWGGNYFPILWQKGCRGFIHWDKMNHHDNRADGELAWTSFDRCALNFRYMWDGNRYGYEGVIKGVGLPTIRIHPTEKPIELYSWILKNYAKPNDNIIDTHGGSMSLAIAVHKANELDKMNLSLTCIEIDTDYYNDAVNRFKEVTRQTTFDFSD